MTVDKSIVFVSCLCLLIICTGSPPADAQDAGPAGGGFEMVEFRDGLITIRVRDMILDELLDKVASQAGVEVRRYTSLGDRVTLSIGEVTPVQALRRVLRGRNYALETGDTGVQTLWLLPDGQAQPQPPPIRSPLAIRDPGERADAISGLGDDLPAVIDTLARALRDDEPAVREAAIFTLAGNGNDQAVDVLGAALSDRNPEIRLLALDALDQIGSVRARVLLQQALGDANPRIRRSAARYLE